MIFLNSYLFALLYTIAPLILSNLIPTFHLTHSDVAPAVPSNRPLFPPVALVCHSLILILTFFYFLLSPFENSFSTFCLTALLHLVSTPHSPLSFSRQLFPLPSHSLHCTFSQLPQSPRYTPQLARPSWIFILCVSYLHTTGLGLKWLKCNALERFKHMHSELNKLVR